MLNKKVFKKTAGKGLSLMKLLLIAVMLAVLSVILFSQISLNVRRAKQAECEANIDAINSAIERHNADNGAYPATLADIIGTDRTRTVYFPDGAPQCPLGGTYIMDSEYKVTCSHKFAR